MKHFTTKFLAVCAFIAVVGSVQAQVIQIYQQQFTGPGLPVGWTTADPSPNNVLWTRCADVTTDCHAPYANIPLYAGLDKANGYMILDSDGAGELGDPHQSQLTSAAIDCSGHDAVHVVFESEIGVFDYSADENAQLLVSTDGINWTPFQIYEGVDAANARFSANPENSDIDITSVAANEPTVYLRWEWIGNYEYWWILDNVRVISPANDLAVSDFFYPVSSYATPVSQIGVDTFLFQAYVSNRGYAPQTNVKLKAYVLEYNAQGQLQGFVHQDSIVVPALAPGVVDSAISIAELFPPELPVGLYAVAYEVSADAVDNNENDNFDGDFFEVTDFLFSKENGPQTASQPADGGDWAVGNYYTMGTLEGANFERFNAVGVEFAFAVNDPQLPEQIDVEISLYKLNDDLEEDFSNFEPDGSSMTLVGTSGSLFDTPEGTENYDLLVSDLFSLATGEQNVLLDPEGRYLVVAGYQGASNTAFHAFNSDVRADFVSTILFIDGQWSLGNFVGRPNAVLRMYIDLAVSTDEKPLAEAALAVSPNPTADFVNLKVKFDEPTDATITIADINGRVIRTENRAGMLDETVNYQMPQLASGTYLARIATANGTRTLKFVVQK